MNGNIISLYRFPYSQSKQRYSNNNHFTLTRLLPYDHCESNCKSLDLHALRRSHPSKSLSNRNIGFFS